MADVVMSSNGRPLARCVECGQVDDHPKHMMYYGTALGMVERHFDCCPPAECDGSCAATLATAGDKRGMALVDHIVNGGA